MRICKHIYIFLLLILIISGCREPFSPDIEGYEDILVIDGLITDQSGTSLVKLSRSYAFDEEYADPEEGAVVMILDETESIYTLTEEDPGVYQGDSTLRGECGKSYKLVVNTSGGDTYESEWVLLQAVPEIDSISHTLEKHETTDPEVSVYGMQLRINTHDESNQTRYYRWEWKETWEFITPIKSSFYPDEERCWRSAGSSTISIGTSEHLSQDIIENYPLYFISTESNKLCIRYSALVSQYSMSQEAYSYWKSLRDITQNTGTLFDPTPATVTGNMVNTADPDLPVLGIFQASAVSQHRIFIDRDELPSYLDIPSGFSSCNFYDVSSKTDMEYYTKIGYPLVEIYYDGLVEHKIFSNAEMCFRCTLSGTNQKPEYWSED